MADEAVVRVSDDGNMLIPEALRAALGIGPGDLVTLRPLGGGVLVSKASDAVSIQPEELLRLVTATSGRRGEQLGVTTEDDLHRFVEEAQVRAYRERYGR